jgi:serine/threonine protein phosphatase PrpC
MDPHKPVATPPAVSLKWFGWTDRGKVRLNNEDSFLGLQFDAREVHHLGRLGEASVTNMDFAFAVSDGMGGAMAGEYASRIAVDKIALLLPRSFQQRATGMEAGFPDMLGELFGEIHHALAYLGSCYEECAGMEATLSLCWITPEWLYFGHIGDSRVYYLPARGDAIKQLSHDDTHVGWLLRNGKLNEREARTHPRRNVLQKALGGGNQFVDPQVGAVGIERGDIFLLSTDGLTDGLYDHSLVELLRTGDGATGSNPARALVEASLKQSGRDNTTALVIRVV